MWRISSIERDVYLYALPKTTIWDFFIKSDLDNAYKNGLFNADVTLRQFKNDGIKNGKIAITFLDAKGKIVWNQSQPFSLGNDDITTLSFKTKINHVKKWSGEDPYLYERLFKVSISLIRV